MNKSLEAFFRGYIFFKVNGIKFYFYNRANNYCHYLRAENKRSDTKINISFTGFSLFNGTRLIYIYNKEIYMSTDKYTTEEILEFKKKIDKMSHFEMAHLLRFSADEYPYFRTDLPELSDYFQDRFNRFGGFTPEISRRLGWDMLSEEKNAS